MRRLPLVLLATVAIAAACSDTGSESLDASAPRDATPAVDAGHILDAPAAFLDAPAALPDVPTADAALDAGFLDAAPPRDAAAPDAPALDAAPRDAAAPDATPSDTGAGDGGPAPDAACVPVGDEACNGRDDDCDGLTDNVDIGDDGIYDCLRIGIFGLQGSGGTSDFLAWLTMNGVGVTRLQTTTTSSLTPAILAGLDIVIIDRLVRPYTPDEARLFADWIDAGGGAVSMSGYTGGSQDVTYPNSLLAELGASYGGGLLNGPATRWNAHPISQGVTSVTFNGGFAVSAMPMVGTSTVVARLNGGQVAGIALERGRGRLFVWGDEWIEFDSQWRSLPQIGLFWSNILGWLAHFR